MKKATDLTLAKEVRDAKIAHLVTDLENSVFLEKENDQLSTMLSRMNADMKEKDVVLTSTTATAKKLAVENIKLKLIVEGQKEYHENIAARQAQREVSLLEREQVWERKEKEMESMLDQKYLQLMNENNQKHRRTAAEARQKSTDDLEDLTKRLTEQFVNRLESSENRYEKRYEDTRALHVAETERWSQERKRLEKSVRTEHDVSYHFYCVLLLCSFVSLICFYFYLFLC